MLHGDSEGGYSGDQESMSLCQKRAITRQVLQVISVKKQIQIHCVGYVVRVMEYVIYENTAKTTMS